MLMLSSVTSSAGPAPEVAAADDTFGFRLLDALQKRHPGENIVLSPVSAALNLSMVLAGAGGETRDEMLAALSLEGFAPTEIDQANADLLKAIRLPAKSITLSVANSLWVDSHRMRLSAAYAKRTRSSYDATIEDLDFSSPDAAARINAWVAKETQGKIPKIIGRIGSDELLLLLNAVYFKGQWLHKFDKAKTEPKDFFLASGSVKKAPRMVQSQSFDYFETPQLQALRLPFGDGESAMDIYLPARSSSLTALETDLTLEHWKSWQAQFRRRRGSIEVPRFELRAGFSLNEPLQTLGMKRAFGEHAQLSGIFSPDASGGGHFYISQVQQSTFWKVDEEGAEAAAATMIGITASFVHQERPFQMIVDRPFFCAIEDLRSGALLFIGAIHDPTA
jgi:serine protease inhibitor